MGIASAFARGATADKALHPSYVLQVLERRDFTSHTRAIASTPVPITSQSEACLPVSV